MNVVSRSPRLPGAGSEEGPTGWWAAAVGSSEWAGTSLSVVGLVQPTLLAVGSDSGLWPRNLWMAELALLSSGPRGSEAGPVVTRHSHWRRAALEPALVWAGSREAGSGLGVGMVATR